MNGSAWIVWYWSLWGGPEILPKRSMKAGLATICLKSASGGTGKLLYSRGFNSVFAEWRTTDEAQHGNRTFSESLRFPNPEGPVEVSVKERDASGFHEVWKSAVDPKDKFMIVLGRRLRVR